VHYWQLSELNVFKIDVDKYQLISADGTVVDIDPNTARLVFLIPGVSSYERLLRDANCFDVHLAESDIREFIELLDSLMLLEEISRPPIRQINPDRAIRNMAIVPTGPVALASLTISLTDACPYKCSYCYRDELRSRSATLSSDAVLMAIQDAAQLGARLVEFSGGEPALFHDELAEYAGAAKSMGIPYIGIVSSGWGLNRESLKQWSANGVNQLNIKLDYWDSHLQDQTCRYEGAWSHAIEAIEAGVDVGMSIRVLTTYFGQPLDQLEKIADFAKRTGASKHVVGVAVPLGGSKPLAPDTVRKCAMFVRDIEKTKPTTQMAIIDLDEAFDTPIICPAGITRAAIGPAGTVTGCSMLEGVHSAGNINEQRLWDLWVDGDWRFYRQPVDLNAKCANCRLRAYCIANCFAFGQALYGDPSMIHEPACPYCTT
jgi:radical SAM protein with 4Fe4S-binding SPASM domain